MEVEFLKAVLRFNAQRHSRRGGIGLNHVRGTIGPRPRPHRVVCRPIRQEGPQFVCQRQRNRLAGRFAVLRVPAVQVDRRRLAVEIEAFGNERGQFLNPIACARPTA